MERLLAEAIQSRRPVLVNPTDEQIRAAAEDLRQAGRLICTVCREPITGERFATRRISCGPRLEALAHVHLECGKDLPN
jgi:hypothetical protein